MILLKRVLKTLDQNYGPDWSELQGIRFSGILL
jgi:hypothetical protein